ncbi:MAG: hypothetical protein OXQ84_10440 [bacterium]|nr:hypothetical protein [bacterium]
MHDERCVLTDESKRDRYRRSVIGFAREFERHADTDPNDAKYAIELILTVLIKELANRQAPVPDPYDFLKEVLDEIREFVVFLDHEACPTMFAMLGRFATMARAVRGQ